MSNLRAPPSTRSAAPGVQMTPGACAELVRRLSSTTDRAAKLHLLDEIIRLTAPPHTAANGRPLPSRATRFMMFELKLLDKLVPIMVAAAGSVSRNVATDPLILDKSLHILCACAWLSWEDPRQAALLSGYPQLVEYLVYVIMRCQPSSSSLAMRCLWNVAWKSETIRCNPSVQILLPMLIFHLSSKTLPQHKYSVGLLWALCDGTSPGARNMTASIVDNHDATRIVLQGLDPSTVVGGTVARAADSQTYFLLLSLMATLLDPLHPSSIKAKQEAQHNNATLILMSLLSRTTSTTLMERICDVLSICLFNQSREQRVFTEHGGVSALIKALLNPRFSKCHSKLHMTLVTALYRNPVWVGPQAQQLQNHIHQLALARSRKTAAAAAASNVLPISLMEVVSGYFKHLCDRFRDMHQTSAETVPFLAAALCIASVAQDQPNLQDYLVSSGALTSMASILIPPATFSAESRFTQQVMGMVMLLQVAQDSPRVQHALCSCSWVATMPIPSPFSGAPAVKKAPLPVLSPSAQGKGYGTIFQTILACMHITPPPTARNGMYMRVQVARLVGCIAERQRPLCALLLGDHASFLSGVLEGLRVQYPSRQQPQMQDDTPLVQLASCLYALAYGPSVTASSQPTCPTAARLHYIANTETAAHFERITKMMFDDPKLMAVLLKLNRHVQTHKQEQAVLYGANTTAGKNSGLTSQVGHTLHALQHNTLTGGGATPSSAFSHQ